MRLPEDLWRMILVEFNEYDYYYYFFKLRVVNKFFYHVLMEYYNVNLPIGPTICFRSTMICTNTCMNCGRDFKRPCNQLSFFTDEPPRRVIIYCDSLYCFKMAVYSQLDAIYRQAGLLYNVKHVINHANILEDKENKILISRTNKTEKTLATAVTRYVYIHRDTGTRYMLCKWYEGMEYFYKLVLIDSYLKSELHLSPF